MEANKQLMDNNFVCIRSYPMEKQASQYILPKMNFQPQRDVCRASAISAAAIMQAATSPSCLMAASCA